jgi:hypothetical protein
LEQNDSGYNGKKESKKGRRWMEEKRKGLIKLYGE